LIIITILFFSCKEKSKEPIKETYKNKKLSFDNFLFFKKNATSSEIILLLDKRKIVHGPIRKPELSEMTGISKLTIKSLKIINQIFPLVEVTFVNDKIAELRFSTESLIDEDYYIFCNSKTLQNAPF
jgi:hypothetical protein